MNKRKKFSCTSEQVDNAFGVIDKALRSTGHMLPENETDVHSSNLLIDIENVSLPNLLRDPMATLGRGRFVLKNGLQRDHYRTNTTLSETRKNLRRAARNGQSIPDEIQSRMFKDRVASIKKTRKS